MSKLILFIQRIFLKVQRKREKKLKIAEKETERRRENRAVMWGGDVTWQKIVARLPRGRKLDTSKSVKEVRYCDTS